MVGLGAAYSEKYRGGTYYLQLYGIGLIALGAWMVVSEFRGRGAKETRGSDVARQPGPEWVRKVGRVCSFVVMICCVLTLLSIFAAWGWKLWWFLSNP